MTNFDKIKTLNIDEKANFLNEFTVLNVANIKEVAKQVTIVLTA